MPCEERRVSSSAPVRSKKKKEYGQKVEYGCNITIINLIFKLNNIPDDLKLQVSPTNNLLEILGF